MSSSLPLSVSRQNGCPHHCQWYHLAVLRTAEERHGYQVKYLTHSDQGICSDPSHLLFTFNWRLEWLRYLSSSWILTCRTLLQCDKECSSHSPRSISVVSTCVSPTCPLYAGVFLSNVVRCCKWSLISFFCTLNSVEKEEIASLSSSFKVPSSKHFLILWRGWSGQLSGERWQTSVSLGDSNTSL